MKLFFLGTIITLFGLSTTPSYNAISESDINDDIEVLFTKMTGNWSCEGTTSKGDVTRALLEITTSNQGRILHYHHTGKGNSKNNFHSMWSFDAATEQLTILRQFATPDQGIFTGVYTSKDINTDSLIISEHPVFKPLWAENRFHYEWTTDGMMTIAWQVKREDIWVTGDATSCKRK